MMFQNTAGTIPVTTAGQSVALWKDKSPKGYNYSNFSVAPTWAGGTSVYFSGGNCGLINSGSWGDAAGYDIFVVGQPLSSTADWRTLLRGFIGSSDHPIIILSGGTALGMYNTVSGFQQFGSLTANGSATILLYVKINSSRQYSASINGGPLTTATTAGNLDAQPFYALGFYQGGSQQWGYLNEMIIVSNTTTAQRQQVEGYLAWKWGVNGFVGAGTPLYPGPVVYLPLEGTTSDGMNAASVSTTGTITYDTGARGLRSAFFSNQANLSAPTYANNYITSTYTLPTTFTASFWLRPLDITTAPRGSTLFSTNSATTNVNNAVSIYFGAASGDSGLKCAFNNIANSANGNTGYPLTVGVWFHTAVTYNNGTLIHYVNGTAYGNTITSTAYISGFQLGSARDGGGAFPYYGYIDDVRLYNYVLSAAQISNLYASYGHPYAAYPPINRIFQPIDIIGCSLWFDAADFSTMSPAGITNGTLVTQMTDKSESGFVFAQSGSGPTLNTTGFNGNYPYLSFNGTSQGLTTSTNVAAGVKQFSANGTDTTFFLVANIPNDGATQNAPFGLVTTDGVYVLRLPWFVGSGNTGFVLDLGGPYTGRIAPSSTSPSIVSTPVILMATRGPSTVSIYRNGAVLSNASASGGFTSTSAQRFGIGTYSAGYSRTNVSELIIYNFALSTSQRQQVEGYLANKWGLTSLLASTHPFYKFPPYSSLLTSPQTILSPVLTPLVLNLAGSTYSSGSTWYSSIGNNFSLGGSYTSISTPGDALALSFYSSGYSWDPTGIAASTISSYTIDIWFSAAGGVAGNLLAEWGQSYYGGYNIASVSLTGNTMYVGYYAGGSSAFQISVGTYIGNTWTHVAFTYSSGTLIGYANGVQISSTTGTKSAPGTSFFALAGQGNPYGSQLVCAIGAFKVYGAALSATQIKQNYNALAPHFGRPTI
jgi:hypothetical protein